MDPVIEQIRRAVAALLMGEAADAERELRAIDSNDLSEKRAAAYALIWGQGGRAVGFKPPVSGIRRKAPSRTDVRAAFTRDRYTCRYSHCQRQTVSADVLRLLSQGFPEVFPFHRNWRLPDTHILYWIYSTSLDHRVPFPSGGTSAADNLVTACYECNDIKNYVPIERLQWEISETADTDWAGLTEYIPLLRSAIADLSRSVDPVGDRKHVESAKGGK